MEQSDFVIVGSGIVGLALALKLRERFSDSSILILEKEDDVARHASGRNSGVLHSGVYYLKDTLKAKFSVAGNHTMREFCSEHHLPLNQCGKLIVARDQRDCAQLAELERRGVANGATVNLISASDARKIDPRVRTHDIALFSPHTATVDPTAICHTLKNLLVSRNVKFRFNARVVGRNEKGLVTGQGIVTGKKIINCAGLYADQIARWFGFSKYYTIVPFKGLYLKYGKNKTDIQTNIYPVPDLRNPFLGVHFTKTFDQTIKIGPTAIPAFWREHYRGLSRFRLGEMCSIVAREVKMMIANSSNFRDLAREEIRRYQRQYFIQQALGLVTDLDPNGFAGYSEPGIRAQLVDTRSSKLVMDFIIEGDKNSTHILNAVSPGFTCAFPFADYIVDRYLSDF